MTGSRNIAGSGKSVSIDSTTICRVLQAQESKGGKANKEEHDTGDKPRDPNKQRKREKQRGGKK